MKLRGTIIVMRPGKEGSKHSQSCTWEGGIQTVSIVFTVKPELQHGSVNSWSLTLPKEPFLCQMRYQASSHVVGLASSQRCD